MLKKTGHIILTMLLLISTFGITVSKHYSGNELFSIALYGDAESCCDGPCDCCTDKTDFYQLDADYILSHSADFPRVQEINLLFTFITLYPVSYIAFSNKSTAYFDDTSPIFTSNTPALLQVFRC